MKLYYFTDEKHALENLEKRHLKVSFSDLVNDLFEFRPFSFQSKKIRGAWGMCIARHATQQGFISFAEDWDVPTMWAHYANSHRGLCYGFEITSQSLVKIGYVDELKEFDSRALSDDEVSKREAAYASRTKSAHWRYEREWRCYVSLSSEDTRRREQGNDLLFLDFGNELELKEVIIGARSKISSTEIRGALGESEAIEVLTARASFREFKMVQQRLKSLQK